MRTRARDLDRTTAIDALERAYADGQLGYDEHHDRTERARAAKSLGELHELISDLQLSTELPEPPAVRRSSRRGGWVVVGLLVALATITVLIWSVVHDDEPAAPAAATQPTPPPAPIPTDVVPIVAPPSVFDTAAGIRSFIDEYRARFGDTIAVDASLYPGGKYAIVTRVIAPDREQSFIYRGGFEESGPPSTRRPDDPTIDLAALNVDAIVGLMAQLPQLIGVADATISHASLEAESTGPHISIYAGNEAGEGGFVDAGFDGGVLRVYPYQR
ncbi:DUF1707 domain-containing protein [Aldersonia sp. NBC_00410]|uniref:DUF1707 SHOCT-like domain-containing protein n=1 Tax=Aldersonia sp. NBC_00410 TaxID=2975954 RepID=UPI00225A8888|nr:DUF1707 domain-containing protein [Aldersonia sp. NBC_00410]MCX5044926.1 DUF1707 domain-containing protein [Aldersonia sp. NBC_00410]